MVTTKGNATGSIDPSGWMVRLLGAVSLEGGDAVIDHFPTRRSALILIRLALAQGRAVTRDAICSDLWPDEFLDVTRTRFRQELKRLNDTLGRQNQFVVSDNLALHLDLSRVQVDLRVAELILGRAAMAPTAREKASILEDILPYADEIAPGYDEPWIESVREDWRGRVSRQLVESARFLAEAGDADRAIAFGKKAASTHLLSEMVQGEFLKLLLELGRRKEALSHISELDRTYRAALGTGPTDRLLRILGTPPVAEAPVPTVRPVRRPLPAALTPLVGREPDILRITDSLTPQSPMRLATLTGPGGIGKTELSLAAGRRLFDTYGGRVWFVSLAGIDNPRFIGKAIQDALGIATYGNDFLDISSTAFGEDPNLLILDNLEQFADGGAHFVRRLLERCPSIKLLLTSRRKLNLDGEQLVSVPPLGEDAAVELFCQVAERARPSFNRGSQDLGRVLEIVNLLDRMPLAIQLASSRASVFSTEEMLAQLSKRFDFLVSRRADIEPRHRSLYQTIAWSYDHLSPEAKRLLLDLSLFRGGWTTTMADQVFEQPGLHATLEELAENSFVYEESIGSEMRFNMLISIREFAQNLQDPVRGKEHLRRLSAALLEFSETASRHLLAEDQFLWMDRLEREHDNICHVMEFASAEDEAVGLALCAKLWRFWSIKGHHHEAKEWFDIFLRPDAPPSQDLMLAIFGAARCENERGNLPAAEALYLRCLEVIPSTGQTQWRPVVEANLAVAYMSRGQLEAGEQTIRRVLAEIDAGQNPYLEGVAHDILATTLAFSNRYKEAVLEAERAVELLRKHPDPIAFLYASLTLARVQMKLGMRSEARQAFQIARDGHARHGHRPGVGVAEQYLAELCLQEGAFEEMEQHCMASLAAFGSVGDRMGFAQIALIRGEAARRLGDGPSAELNLEEARKHLSACGAEAVLGFDLYAPEL